MVEKSAQLAGIFFLLAGATSAFSLFIVRKQLINFEDAAITANNLTVHETMFRWGIISNLLSQLFQLLLGLTLYRMLKGVHKQLATVLLAAFVITVAIAVLNNLNSIGALLILGNKAGFLNVFEPEKRAALMLLFLKMGNYGQALLEIFWTVYLFAFGWVIIKSALIPRIFGIAMMIGCWGYTVNSFTKILVPDFHPAFFSWFAM